jgi:hypothetical protein
MDIVCSSQMSLDEWVKFFKKVLGLEDLKEDIAESFIRHLADLNAITSIGGGQWKWKNCNPSLNEEELILQVKKDLEEKCKTESGFVLPYFIGYKELVRTPLADIRRTEKPPKPVERKNLFDVQKEAASDLSNLQIVKKVGRQLQPFLQLEESVISSLAGKHVCKQDAKKLFHYMFSKVGAKAEPRKWEQLSRKRHR